MARKLHIFPPFRTTSLCGRYKEDIKKEGEGVASISDDSNCDECRRVRGLDPLAPEEKIGEHYRTVDTMMAHIYGGAKLVLGKPRPAF